MIFPDSASSEVILHWSYYLLGIKFKPHVLLREGCGGGVLLAHVLNFEKAIP